MRNLLYLVYGGLFGIILTKSEVISWFRIQDMFLFNEPHMYLIIGSAVLTGALSVFVLKIMAKKNRVEYNFTPKQYNKGFIFGSLIFGVGWALAGACPGPIFAQIGTGAWPAILTLGGALFGALSYQKIRSKLPH